MQCSGRCQCFKIIFRVLRFLDSNLRKLKPCKIQAFSHSFHARKYSINGQFPQILWKCAKSSAETVFFREHYQDSILKGLYFTRCYLYSCHIFEKYSLDFASYYNPLFFFLGGGVGGGGVVNLWFSDYLFWAKSQIIFSKLFKHS